VAQISHEEVAQHEEQWWEVSVRLWCNRWNAILQLLLSVLDFRFGVETWPVLCFRLCVWTQQLGTKEERVVRMKIVTWP